MRSVVWRIVEYLDLVELTSGGGTLIYYACQFVAVSERYCKLEGGRS